MSVIPRVVRRLPGLVDLAIRNRPGTVAYRIGAAETLDLAYAGVTTMFDVPTGGTFISPRLQRSKINRVEESSLGLTRAMYDPADYASATIPGDTDISFIRVFDIDSGGGVDASSPILVVPTPDFYETGRRNMILNGSAPDLASRGNNLPPQNAMRFFFTKFADEVIVYNEEVAPGGNDLFFSFGLGLQEMRVPAGTSRGFSEAGANEIIIRGSGGAVSFSISAAIVNGIQA